MVGCRLRTILLASSSSSMSSPLLCWFWRTRHSSCTYVWCTAWRVHFSFGWFHLFHSFEWFECVCVCLLLTLLFTLNFRMCVFVVVVSRYLFQLCRNSCSNVSPYERQTIVIVSVRFDLHMTYTRRRLRVFLLFFFCSFFVISNSFSIILATHTHTPSVLVWVAGWQPFWIH